MRKNALFMMLYEVVVYLAPFITAPYIARVLGTFGTGVYSYTYSVASYFVVLIQLGVTLYGRREIASCLDRKTRSETFWSIWLIETAMFAVSSVLYFCFLTIVGPELKTAFLLQYLTLVGAWLDISWLFFGCEDFKLAVSRNVLVKFLSLVLVFALVKKSSDTNLYVAIMSASNAASVVVMWTTLRRHVDITRVSFDSIKKQGIPMVRMFVPVLSTQLFSMTDKVFLGFMGNVDAVGIYENAYKISRVPIALITTIGTVMLPRMTRFVAEGRESESKQYFAKSLSLTMFIGVGCAFGLIGVAPTFIPVYLGDGFLDAVVILQLLSLVLVVIAWGNVFRTQIILPRKMDNLYLKSVLLAAIINVVLNTAMIPAWGAVGAAIASIIAELVICVYQTYKIREHFVLSTLFSGTIKYFVAAFAMVAAIILFEHVTSFIPIVSLLLQIVIGASVYVAVSSVLELVFKERAVTAEFNTLIGFIKYKIQKR